MKNMLKDAMILFLITLVSGALLGLVYDVTKEPIKEQEEKAKQEALKQVFAAADSFEVLYTQDDDFLQNISAQAKEQGYDASITEVCAAKDSAGGQLGYVFSVTDHAGYGGDISFTMGITAEGVMNGISFLSISETAGLGMRAPQVLSPQLENRALGLQPFLVSKTGAAAENEIDAISGATITSNAVVGGVNAGKLCYSALTQGGGAQVE